MIKVFSGDHRRKQTMLNKPIQLLQQEIELEEHDYLLQ